MDEIEKIKRYCAYQERCLYDVRRKMETCKIDKDKTEIIINELVIDGYIDEERFAKMFARGKFNIKSWGIRKIIVEMEKRNIKKDYINKAIQEIEHDVCEEKLNGLACKWLDKNPKGNQNEKRQKLFRYLVSKGYEFKEVRDCINKHIK